MERIADRLSIALDPTDALRYRSMIDRVVIALCAVLLAAFLWVLYDRGGPYFDRPATVVEHVDRKKHDTRDALLLLAEVRPLIPRGVSVACFRPEKGKAHYDTGPFHTAIGMLPHQFVVPPFAANEGLPKVNLADYVVAVGEPFTHPGYELQAEYPTGRLYKAIR